MDKSIKKRVSMVLILLGIAAVVSVGYANYLSTHAPRGLSTYYWHWGSWDIFLILAGIISAGVGISTLDSIFNREAEEKHNSQK